MNHCVVRGKLLMSDRPKFGCFDLFKIDGNGGGLKNVARKQRLSRNGGWHVVMGFFWRFLMMQIGISFFC